MDGWEDRPLAWVKGHTLVFRKHTQLQLQAWGSEPKQHQSPYKIAALEENVERGPLLAEDTSVPPVSFCLPIMPPEDSEMLSLSSRLSTWPWPSATQQSNQGKFQQKHALCSEGVWLVRGAGVCQHTLSRCRLTVTSSSGNSPL